MSQDARLAAGSFVQGGASGGTTPARSQHGRSTALISGGAYNRVGLPPLLPPGATRGSRDSRAICPPPRQRATGLQRNQQCSDFTEVEPVQAEVPLEDDAPNRESGRVGARGGLRHPDNGTTLGRATNGVATPLGSSTVAETAADERRPIATRIPAEGFISTRTRACTRMSAKVQQEVDLHPVLQQVLSLGRSADTPDERAIRSRAAAGELSASGAGPTLIQKEWTCHGAPQSEARRTSKNNGVARSLSHKRIRRVHPCLLYTSPSPRDATLSRMPSSA